MLGWIIVIIPLTLSVASLVCCLMKNRPHWLSTATTTVWILTFITLLIFIYVRMIHVQESVKLLGVYKSINGAYEKGAMTDWEKAIIVEPTIDFNSRLMNELFWDKYFDPFIPDRVRKMFYIEVAPGGGG